MTGVRVYEGVSISNWDAAVPVLSFNWKPVPVNATFEVIWIGFVVEDFEGSVTDVAANVTVAGATGFDWEA